MMLVAKNLYREYRPIATWFWAIIGAATAVTTAVVAIFHEVRFSFWLLIAGQGIRYFLLVIGILLITGHLKLFVAGGITRRDFLRGAGVFGALTATAYAAVVPVGHGVERLIWTAFGTPPDSYPGFTVVSALREFATMLPAGLAGFITGAFIAAGFYRYHWIKGMLLIVPGLLPLASAEVFLTMYAGVEDGRDGLLPLGAAVALTLALVAGLAAVMNSTMRNVAIRAATG